MGRGAAAFCASCPFSNPKIARRSCHVGYDISAGRLSSNTTACRKGAEQRARSALARPGDGEKEEGNGAEGQRGGSASQRLLGAAVTLGMMLFCSRTAVKQHDCVQERNRTESAIGSN